MFVIYNYYFARLLKSAKGHCNVMNSVVYIAFGLSVYCVLCKTDKGVSRLFACLSVNQLI